MSDLGSIYKERYSTVLKPISTGLRSLLRNHLAYVPRIDRVDARAKEPDRFLAKAAKTLENGQPKYTDPVTQIQDQVGARVVVFYTTDVEPIGELVKKYFRHIEEQRLVPDTEWEFGYFGKHFIFALPKEAIPPEVDSTRAPAFFELQIKTLFQHAWSEADHDLGYKAPKALTPDQKRRLAFTAAQAWGADHIFEGLFAELEKDEQREP